jgi:hypothetical protein
MVAAQGVSQLIAVVRDDGDTRLPNVARQVLQVLANQIEQIETAITALERPPPGWGWCRGRIQPVGKPGWAVSRSAATVICGGCSSMGQAPICCDRRRQLARRLQSMKIHTTRRQCPWGPQGVVAPRRRPLPLPFFENFARDESSTWQTTKLGWKNNPAREV